MLWLALIGTVFVDPLWFAARMQALGEVPAPVWMLAGLALALHGARRIMRSRLAPWPGAQGRVPDNTRRPRCLRFDSPGAAAPGPDAWLLQNVLLPEGNAALSRWRRAAVLDGTSGMASDGADRDKVIAQRGGLTLERAGRQPIVRA
ncbi:hypothetical protein AB1M95_06280 [Sulfitobacter sp. LCG007]